MAGGSPFPSMNQIFQVAALLVVTLSTNEVKIGTATIGSDTFDVVGLQATTPTTAEKPWAKWLVEVPGVRVLERIKWAL